MTIDKNDPRLTAYALDELDEATRAEIEALIADDPEAREEIEAIRAMGSELTTLFATEPTVELTSEQHKKIEEAAQIGPERSRPVLLRIVRFAAVATAACICAIALVNLYKVQHPSVAYNERSEAVPEKAGPIPASSAESKQAATRSITYNGTTPEETPLPEIPKVARDRRDRGTLAQESVNKDDTNAPSVAVARPTGTGTVGATLAEQSKKVDTLLAPARIPPAAPTPSSVTTRSAPAKRKATTAVTALVKQPVTKPSVAPAEAPVGTAASASLVKEVKEEVAADLSIQAQTTLVAAKSQTRAAAAARPERDTLASMKVAAPVSTAAVPSSKIARGVVTKSRMQPQAFALGVAVSPAILEENRADTNTTLDSEAYDHISENSFRKVADEPLSTFSIDVDTASYANVRRFLNQNSLPPKDAVRIEELVNYFPYDYKQPQGQHPFSVDVAVGSCPWNPAHRLAMIGLKGKDPDAGRRPASNLVFLLDVSGSMNSPNKLPLLKKSMHLLIDRLTENDSVAIVVYAGASGLVLPPTSGDRASDIREALDRLQAGGSTNGGSGIQLAYQTAVQNFIKGGINRVILATDGDFNIGITNRGDLTRLIEEKAKTGVFLSVLGFGQGNYQDSGLEMLADKGNGNYAYIDTAREAKKVLVEQVGATLITIAKDVKIQVEFNPAQVSAYRLIGYENRKLANQDFNDDTKDAGEIGAGHTVSAFYEIVPAGQQIDVAKVDELKYQAVRTMTDVAASGELLTVKLRYKKPDEDVSSLLSVPLKDSNRRWSEMDDDFQFASSVALFGMVLRDSPYRNNASLDLVAELATSGIGADKGGYRKEFLDLVNRAMALVK